MFSVTGMRPLHQQFEAHAPMAEIRERHDGPAADAQQVFEHDLGLARRLDRLRQDHVVERIVGIIRKVGVGIALDDRQSLGEARVDAFARNLDPAPVDALAVPQQSQEIAVAAADIEHARAGRHHVGEQQEIETWPVASTIMRFPVRARRRR